MRIKKIIMGISISALMLVSACGKKSVDAPELLEPLATNEAYRTVEYGDIGDCKMYYGTIVPTEHCQFFKTATNIKEIKVEVGDYVNEGDVLATADIDSISENISALNASISVTDKINALLDKKYEYDLQYLKDKLNAAMAASDSYEQQNLAKEIAIMEENHNFDLKMRDKRRKSVASEIAELQGLILEGSLVADTSGYVSYVKDLSEGTFVNSTENVVIISDKSDRYISVVDTTVKMNILKNATMVCTLADGKKVNLIEYPYPSEAVVAAQNKTLKLPLRMKYEDESTTQEIGETIPIYVYGDVSENVLVVSNDSLMEDEDGYYVYVQNGDSKEERRVTLGKRDVNFSEVLSGLSEGERVYYSTDRAIISDYSEYVIEKSEYVQLEEINKNSYKLIDGNVGIYSKYEGKVAEVCVSSGDEVNKGDIICKIDTNEGSAHIVELKLAIDNYKDAHTKTVTENNNRKNELEATLLNLEADSEEYKESKYELDKLIVDIELEDIQYKYQLDEMQREYGIAMKDNDGRGVMSVRACDDGVVKKINLKEDQFINSGDCVAEITNKEKRKLIVASEKIEPTIETTIDISNTYSGEQYNSSIYGIASNEKAYVTIKEDRVYITNNTNSNLGGYVSIEDEKILDNLGSYKIRYNVSTIRDVIVVPSELVYEEDVKTEYGDKKYYVWKLSGEEVVKQYICIAPTLVSDMKNYYVISGLDFGDILAKEKK